MSGTHCPQSPLPPPSVPPGFLSHKPRLSFFFPPICCALRAKPAGEGGPGAWRPASREAAAASPAPAFAAESADGARLGAPWRRAPAGSRVPRPHPSPGRPTAAWLLDFTAVRQGDFWAAAPCESRRKLGGEGGSQRSCVFKRDTGCEPGFCNCSAKGFEGKTLLGSPSGRVGAALQGMYRRWQVRVSQTRQHHLLSWSLQTILCPGGGYHPGSIVEIRLGKENQEPAGFCGCVPRWFCPCCCRAV